jgi:hypothetical protein
MNGHNQIQVIQRPVQLDVIETTDPREMETEVNKRLKDGFLFHGDMKVIVQNGELNFIQSMVKTEIVPVPMPRNLGGSIVVPQ